MQELNAGATTTRSAAEWRQMLGDERRLGSAVEHETARTSVAGAVHDSMPHEKPSDDEELARQARSRRAEKERKASEDEEAMRNIKVPAKWPSYATVISEGDNTSTSERLGSYQHGGSSGSGSNARDREVREPTPAVDVAVAPQTVFYKEGVGHCQVVATAAAGQDPECNKHWPAFYCKETDKTSWDMLFPIPDDEVEAAFHYKLRQIGNGAVDGRLP